MPSVLWRCWLGGRKGIRPVKTEHWGAGVVICLERGADSGFHCHSLSLASVKSTLVLPFWYRLTRVVPDKGPLSGCVCVYSDKFWLTLTLTTAAADVRYEDVRRVRCPDSPRVGFASATVIQRDINQRRNERVTKTTISHGHRSLRSHQFPASCSALMKWHTHQRCNRISVSLQPQVRKNGRVFWRDVDLTGF